MHNFCIEEKTLGDKESVACNIARHLRDRSQYGKVAVITDKPLGTLSAVKKQWMRLTRQILTERSRTLKIDRIYELSLQLNQAKDLTFSAKWPENIYEASVVFAKANDFMVNVPSCHTLYVTIPISQKQFKIITSCMPKDGTVVLYARK